jgi:hypothetical protein
MDGISHCSPPLLSRGNPLDARPPVIQINFFEPACLMSFTPFLSGGTPLLTF